MLRKSRGRKVSVLQGQTDRQLPFIDIVLSREEDGSMSTSVHRKATHMDQYLCFQSHHPSSHKRAVVRTQLQQTEGREWCTASLVPNVLAPISAKQEDPWMSAFGNTAGP